MTTPTQPLSDELEHQILDWYTRRGDIRELMALIHQDREARDLVVYLTLADMRREYADMPLNNRPNAFAYLWQAEGAIKQRLTHKQKEE
jgi:hypothetical protein